VKIEKSFLMLCVLGLLSAACSSFPSRNAPSPITQTTHPRIAEQSPGRTLQAVKALGKLWCGIDRDDVPGFAKRDNAGNYSGFDVDYCRAVAAGVLGDPNAIIFVPLAANERFPQLRSGRIDVLIRETTWTASRDGLEGMAFVHSTYYDGQGIMVRTDSFSSPAEMDNKVICALSGTTTEQHIQARMPRSKIRTFKTIREIQDAFLARECDGWSSDLSKLAALRLGYPEGATALQILPTTLSTEPLGPVVRDGDSEWYDAVNWIVLSTILAEELDITKNNVAQMKSSPDPGIRRLLGQPTGDQGTVFDPGLGLPPDFVLKVISTVGNYGEIFDRNFGPLNLDRGLNALWNDRQKPGLQFAPPFE
jgi:general L-amino acid transport system substrate-binding protein